MKIRSFVLSSIVAVAAAFSLGAETAASAPRIVVSPLPGASVRGGDDLANGRPTHPVAAAKSDDGKPAAGGEAARRVVRGNAYTSKDDVADYLLAFGCLPPNFITKGEARRLGWTGGPLEPYAPGKSIGGDHFGNYEKKLPRGRYRECDIDTLRRPRGAKRIIYSDDRRLYYTGDHYRTFQRINRK